MAIDHGSFPQSESKDNSTKWQPCRQTDGRMSAQVSDRWSLLRRKNVPCMQSAGCTADWWWHPDVSQSGNATVDVKRHATGHDGTLRDTTGHFVRFVQQGARELAFVMARVTQAHFSTLEITPCFPYWGNPNDLQQSLQSVEGAMFCRPSMALVLATFNRSGQ